MKKYWKLSTVILASSMLISSSVALLINRNGNWTNNQILLNNFNKDQQANNVQIINSINDIKFIGSVNSYGSMFALVKGKTDETDRLYAWGNNDSGQLGVGDIKIHSVPTHVELPAKVQKISYILVLSSCTLLISDDNSIWATGNNSYGTFGNGKFSASSDITTSFEHATDFFVGKKITSVSNGLNHIAIVVDNSELYTWGDNGNDQLGTGSSYGAINIPTPVTKTLDDKSFLNGSIAEVKCGYEFTVLKVSDSGKNYIYCWGHGGNGQLGFGDTDGVQRPKLLEDPLIDGFSNIYVAPYGVFAYNDTKHQLFAWGMNVFNQLGLKEPYNRTSPNEISLPFPATEKITNVLGSSSETRILTTTGKVYTTGSGTDGASNNGLGVDATTFTEIKMAQLVSNIVVSGQTTFAFSSDKIYAWGNGHDNGTYGYGITTSSPTPIPVDPFSNPSSLIQIKQENARTTAEIAKAIYSDSNIFDETTFKSYIDLTKFPTGTTFTMTSAPVADALKGEIKCTVQANQSYSQPDGAKIITDASFEIILKGFKTPTDMTTDDTGLIIGLSIGGALLLLIITGLVIWYLKFKNKDGYSADQSVLY